MHSKILATTVKYICIIVIDKLKKKKVNDVKNPAFSAYVILESPLTTNTYHKDM